MTYSEAIKLIKSDYSRYSSLSTGGRGLKTFLSIIINTSARIGSNVSLSQFLTIGSTKGKAATIEDNVYIGPSVCLVEDITIGHDAVIGAGAVVTKDIPPYAVAAGVPAKIIHYKNK